MYLVLKHAHMTFVMLSILLFTLRGIWMLQDSPRLTQKWVRILPHIVDTGLLLTAIGLVCILGVYPFQADWLTAKLVGLIAYIVLGVIALKRGKTKSTRLTALIAAWLVLLYIVCVAFTKTALPFIH